jgi:glutamate formiminotransferase/formiminotetrahydrofolate cyclodeaminase
LKEVLSQVSEARPGAPGLARLVFIPYSLFPVCFFPPPLAILFPMPSTLVECVPNFSEGRDAAKVDSIVEAMKIPGVYLLDREMDVDHNRCVITLVGEREAIQEAAIRGVGRAAELIDLNGHQGAHPRMGASDVVPFIPIDGVTIEDCVAMARHVGAEIFKRFGIPVYLYEAAATRPERQNLENIRRGQFEGIRDDIATNDARLPDFGEPRVHPTAGATVVGARKPLIAYNVFLSTPEVEIAKKIAKAVRNSSGGLRFVKGAGFLVRGLAQVSMNLTDFEQTPIHRVFEFVKREAARYGVIPVSSEIVGLIPKLALEQAAEWFLQVENFDSSLILENRLAAVMGGKSAVGGIRAGIEPFIEQLAAPTATPGGGSAAAASAAMAAGLAVMVATMSRGKKAYLQFEPQLSEAIARLNPLARRIESRHRRRRRILQRRHESLQSSKRIPRWQEPDQCGAASGHERPAGRGRARSRGSRHCRQPAPTDQPHDELRPHHRHRARRSGDQGRAGKCRDQFEFDRGYHAR